MNRTTGPHEVERRRQVLQESAAGATEVAVEPTATGPAAIESAHDAAIVVPELVRLAPLAEQRGYAAITIGCYSDPGIGRVCLTRRNVGGSHTPGNHTAETRLAG